MIDLHTHSTVSDGSVPPEEIPSLAATAGCSAVALTDHDRLDGTEAARARAEELGIRFVPGCEVSCEWSPGTCHVLVYFVEPVEGPLQEELRRLQDDRDTRNRRLADRLGELGVQVTLDEVAAEAKGQSIGRPHFAAVMVRKGVVQSIQEAFDSYLAKGRPAYVPKARLSARDVASLARASGGVPVLAHPLSLGLDRPATASAIAALAEDGLAGIECHYGRYSPEERSWLLGVAKTYSLVATGGSDFHGDYKPDLSVGVGTGDLEVPDAVLDELEERRPD
jgi:predicted metal-dependent phosphoesterase TrpH